MVAINKLPYKWCVYILKQPSVKEIYSSEVPIRIGRYRDVTEFAIFWKCMESLFNGTPFGFLNENTQLFIVHCEMNLQKHVITSKGSAILLKYNDLKSDLFYNLIILLTTGSLVQDGCSVFGLNMKIESNTYTIKIYLDSQNKICRDSIEKKIIEELGLSTSTLTFVSTSKNIFQKRKSFLVKNKKVKTISKDLLQNSLDNDYTEKDYKNKRIFEKVEWDQILKFDKKPKIKEQSKPKKRHSSISDNELIMENQFPSGKLRERDKSWIDKRTIRILGLRKSIDFSIASSTDLDIKDLILKETTETKDESKNSKKDINVPGGQDALKRAIKESMLLEKYFSVLNKNVFVVTELRNLSEEHKRILDKQTCIFCFKPTFPHLERIAQKILERKSFIKQKKVIGNEVNFYLLHCVKEPKCFHIIPFNCLAEEKDFTGFEEHINKRFSGEVTEYVCSSKYKRHCTIIKDENTYFRVEIAHVLNGRLIKEIQMKREVYNKIEYGNFKNVYIIEGCDEPLTLANGLMKIWIRLPYMNKKLDIIYDLSKYLDNYDNVKLYFKYPLTEEGRYNFVKLEVFIRTVDANSFNFSFLRISFTKVKS